MIETRSQYHVALADVGLVLQGSPENPGYVLEQASTFNSRYAQGDRGYDDFSKWWYWAQTDWFQGIKDSTSWEDDGKFYYSTNVDVWSEAGAMKLAKIVTADEDFTERIVCGGVFEVDGTTKQYIGTRDNGSGRPQIYQASTGAGQTWSEISSTTFGTNQSTVAHMSGRAGILWVSLTGAGATDLVNTWDGTTWTDQSSFIDIGAALSFTASSSRCHVTVGNTMYVFLDDSLNDFTALVKTTVTNPTASGDWSLVFEKANADSVPVACAEFQGSIYYLFVNNPVAELRKYDIANAEDSLVETFKNVSIESTGVGDKLLTVFNGYLVITLDQEIWKFDGASLERLFKIDSYKDSDIGEEATPFLDAGCVSSDNKLWWGNLMFDGVNFFNTFKNASDTATEHLYPLYSDGDGVLFFTDTADDSILSYYSLASSSYKSTVDKNFLVMSQFDNVSGIDKLLYSVTLIFKKFSSGQTIEVEYLTSELNSSSTWSSLGTASYSLDGASATEKTLYFPVNTTAKKIWYRIQLDGDGSNTPVLYDVVTAYLPRPYVDRQWRLNFDCGNTLELLNRGLENKTGREIKNRIEQAWMTNQIVDFQDLDYASTAINNGAGITDVATSMTVDSTAEFPESGRLRVEDEIMYYTGKTPVSFTGLSRGQKGTKAVSHSDNTTVHNGYKVIVQSFNARVPVLNTGRDIEYIIGVSLREVI